MNWLIDDYIDDLRAAMEGWVYSHSLDWALAYEGGQAAESLMESWLDENCECPMHDCNCEIPEFTDAEIDAEIKLAYASWADVFGVPDLMIPMKESIDDFDNTDCPWDELVIFTRAIHLEHVHGTIVDHCSKLTEDIVNSISQNGLEQTFGKDEVERFVREW